MFIKLTNSDNRICYVNISNIQYVEHRELTNSFTKIERATRAAITFGDRSCIFTQESAEDIMKLIAKANKQTNK